MSIKTHTGIIITNDGEKRVKLRETPTTWCVGPKETYRKEDGRRCGAPLSRRRLLLSTIKPIGQVEQPTTPVPTLWMHLSMAYARSVTLVIAYGSVRRGRY